MTKTIAKGRFRSDLPGRQTEALATAIRQSQNAFTSQMNSVPTVLNNNAAGLQKFLERVSGMNPAEIERRALDLKYKDLEPRPAPVPGYNPAHVVPMPSPVGTIAPAGIVAKATVVYKPRLVRTPDVAVVAPSGQVVMATLAPVVNAVVPSGDDWGAFIANYLKHKAHDKNKSLLEYLQAQYASGLVFNGNTKRFAKR